jgi:hypothetical protein
MQHHSNAIGGLVVRPESGEIIAAAMITVILALIIDGLNSDFRVLKTLVRGLVVPATITTVVVCVIIRLEWDSAGPSQRIAMVSGGPGDIRIKAVVLGFIVFRATCLFMAEPKRG